MSKFSNEFQVGDSPGYALFSVCLHAGAALVLLLSDIASTLPLPGVALIVAAWLTLFASAVVDFRRSGMWRSRKAIAHISVARRTSGPQGGSWLLRCRSGECFGPAAITSGRVLSSAICLHLRDESGRGLALCVPADALPTRMFRRLRVIANRALTS